MNQTMSTLAICAPLMTSFTYLIYRTYNNLEKNEKTLRDKRLKDPGYNPFKDEIFTKKTHHILDIVLNHRGP